MNEISLTDFEMKVLLALRKRVLTANEIANRFRNKKMWVIEHSLELLEDYGLIDELTHDEYTAYLAGQDYIGLGYTSSNELSGKYVVTRHGELIIEQIQDGRIGTIRDMTIGAVSAIIGAITGGLISFLINCFS